MSEIDVSQWSNALIRAVAERDPGLLRIEDPRAVRVFKERDIERIGSDRAKMMMDRRAVRFVDCASYGQLLAEREYERFELAGQHGTHTWLVAHGRDTDEPAGYVPKLPSDIELIDEQWPVELTIAWAEQHPASPRSMPERLTAVPEANIADHALALAFSWLPPELESRFDLEGWIEAATLRVETPTLGVWRVIAEREHSRLRSMSFLRAQLGSVAEGVQGLMGWSDELIAAVAHELPSALASDMLPHLLAGPEAAVRGALGDDDPDSLDIRHFDFQGQPWALARVAKFEQIAPQS